MTDESPPAESPTDSAGDRSVQTSLDRGGDVRPADASSDRRVDGAQDPATGENGEPDLAGIVGARSDDAPPREPITAGDPSFENALFVALGVLGSILVLYQLSVVMIP